MYKQINGVIRIFTRSVYLEFDAEISGTVSAEYGLRLVAIVVD